MGDAPGLAAFVNTNVVDDVDAGTGGRSMLQRPFSSARTVCGGEPGIEDVEIALPLGANPAIVEPRPPRCRTTLSWKWDKKRKAGAATCAAVTETVASAVSRMTAQHRVAYTIGTFLEKSCFLQ